MAISNVWKYGNEEYRRPVDVDGEQDVNNIP